MLRHLFRIALLCLCLAPALAFAQAGPIGGTWKAVVLKQKDQRVSLTKDGYSLLISIDDKTKTWTATAKTKSGEEQRRGTFAVDDQHIVFSENGGAKHVLKVQVNDNQLVISPKSDPDTRLVALRVE